MNTDKITQGLDGLTGMFGKEKASGDADIMGSLSGAMTEGRNYHKAGPEGTKSGRDFDESELIGEKQKQPAGIVIRSGGIIDAIQVLYTDGERGPLHGSSSGGQEQVIRFEDGDSLAGIQGRKGISFGGGKSFAKVVIKTVKGKTYGPFGSWGGGTDFKLEIPKGGEFKGLCGNAGTGGNGGYVAQLGLIYYKKEK